MENKNYSSIIGNSAAPFENLIAQECGLATNYHAVAHPSLPNYIALTSGSTQGITDDDPPSAHPLNVDSIFGQVQSKSYEETMPTNCALSGSGNYAVRHNPEAYYLPVRTQCATDNVPMGSLASGALQNDVASGTLPAFSFLTPNLCNDMHDCSVATGDAWLAGWVPQIVAGSDYQTGHLAIVIVFDENGGGGSNQVYAAVISPYTVPGTHDATNFTHYSLLRTTEEILGAPLLGNAGTATSMRAAFGW
jgi:phospholipase C